MTAGKDRAGHLPRNSREESMNNNQEELVLDYLRKHKRGITSMEGFEKLGIVQMPKRMFNLKRLGYKIITTPCKGKNRYGKKVSFVRWALA